MPWSNMSLTPLYGVIDQRFRCDPIAGEIRCIYVIEHHLCEISAPSISMFYVLCENGVIDLLMVSLTSDFAVTTLKVRLGAFMLMSIIYVKFPLPRLARFM